VREKPNLIQIQKSGVVKERYTKHLKMYDRPPSILPVFLNVEFEEVHLTESRELISAVVVKVLHV
jgi:hypothetical protein